MREGCLDLMTLIGVYQFITSNLVRLQDLFGFVLWFNLLCLFGKQNLISRAIIQSFFAVIACMNVYHIYTPILEEDYNFEINGITFLAVLALTDMYTFSLDLVLNERIQVIIKKSFVALCIFLLVSAYIAYFAYMKFCFIEWVGYGPLNLSRNFISFRGDISTFPEDKMIAMSDQDLSFTQTTYIVDVESHVMSIYSERQVFYKDMKTNPITKYAIKRYIGEGARLECEFKVGAKTLEQFYSIHSFISKDRLDIQNSYRHKIQTLYLNQSESLVYNIALDIFPLTKEDFGTYRAGIRLYQDSSEKVLSRSEHQLYDEIELYICVFSVLQIDDYYIYKDVPVGGLLSFGHLFLVAVSNSSNVRVEHIVNGVQFNLIPGITPECCLNSVQSPTGTVSNMKLLKHPEYSSNKSDIFEIVATICLCPSLFGIHRIKLVHDMYDPEEQKWKTLQFMHPQITVVYPTSPALQWINISEQERFLTESSKTDKDFSLFNGTSFQYLQNATRFEFGVMNTLEVIILLVTALLFLIAMYWSLILLLYLVNVTNRLILTTEIPFQEELGHKRKQIHGSNTEDQVSTSDIEKNMYAYDAFISHVDEDRHFVKYILQPILLQHRLRVFLGDDDLPPGPIIENLETAIKQSKIVLIVISNAYLTDQLYKFFFPNIVLPLLHDGRISCDKVVLIKYKPCQIPTTWLAHDKIIVVEIVK